MLFGQLSTYNNPFHRDEMNWIPIFIIPFYYMINDLIQNLIISQLCSWLYNPLSLISWYFPYYIIYLRAKNQREAFLGSEFLTSQVRHTIEQKRLRTHSYIEDFSISIFCLKIEKTGLGPSTKSRAPNCKIPKCPIAR